MRVCARKEFTLICALIIGGTLVFACYKFLPWQLGSQYFVSLTNDVTVRCEGQRSKNTIQFMKVTRSVI